MAFTMTSVVRRGDHTDVTVTGELDWADIEAFRGGLEIHLHRSAEVRLDLEALRSWSPSAQVALAGALRAARGEGRRVVVQGLHGRAARQLSEPGISALVPGQSRLSAASRPHRVASTQVPRVG